MWAPTNGLGAPNRGDGYYRRGVATAGAVASNKGGGL